MGVAIGAGLGVAFGVLLDNLALGIGVGTALGVTIGAILDERRAVEVNAEAASPEDPT